MHSPEATNRYKFFFTAFYMANWPLPIIENVRHNFLPRSISLKGPTNLETPETKLALNSLIFTLFESQLYRDLNNTICILVFWDTETSQSRC